ncbi:alpha/beta hydrolase [Kribbella pittospori]|uniref:Alpha/beta hydrolase n=2 Tax=Kribbella pittospori TaxID=722689 RepID=A0A4R0KL23_9ACTN|nr:alpha/beta hydrolase [Kribbella pittospori]
MLGAGEQFWRIGAALAERGYRAVAVVLPGHGRSPAAPDASVGMFAASVVDTVGCEPELAIGHSLGGVVLAAALPVLRPARAVYVDIPLADDGAQRTTDELTSGFLSAQAGRTVEALRVSKPRWSEKDLEVEAVAAKRFDVATAVALELAHRGSQPPTAEIPSLVVRAEPSRYVSKARAAELAALGFEVRSVPGAGHSIWYGHFAEFMDALEGWI